MNSKIITYWNWAEHLSRHEIEKVNACKQLANKVSKEDFTSLEKKLSYQPRSYNLSSGWGNRPLFDWYEPLVNQAIKVSKHKLPPVLAKEHFYITDPSVVVNGMYHWTSCPRGIGFKSHMEYIHNLIADSAKQVPLFVNFPGPSTNSTLIQTFETPELLSALSGVPLEGFLSSSVTFSLLVGSLMTDSHIMLSPSTTLLIDLIPLTTDFLLSHKDVLPSQLPELNLNENESWLFQHLYWKEISQRHMNFDLNNKLKSNLNSDEFDAWTSEFHSKHIRRLLKL